jgi:glutamate synthase (NADPH/NADH) small chain
VPGEDLDGVLDALDFIERVIRKDLASMRIGRRVGVIGCGNTAMDAANCARKLGCDVTVFYRRTEQEAPAYPGELELAKSLGVQFRWETTPVALHAARATARPAPRGSARFKRPGARAGGPLARATFDVVRPGRPDRKGHRKLAPVKGERFVVELDTVIRAVGQDRIEELLNDFDVRHARGRAEVDARTRRTSNPKVWAGGDLANGGLEVVNAVEEGKAAARSILDALGLPHPAGSRFVEGELEVARR